MKLILYTAAVALALGAATPALAQTVIYPDPPRARADSARPPAGGRDPASPDTTRRDTTRATPPAPPPTPAPVPAAAPPADPLPSGICAQALPGEAAPDVLGIVFESSSSAEVRDAAIATVAGKRLAGTAEDQFQYVGVPAGGSEFRLRALADKLIRLTGINEVGPVACPATPAPPAKRDSG